MQAEDKKSGKPAIIDAIKNLLIKYNNSKQPGKTKIIKTSVVIIIILALLIIICSLVFFTQNTNTKTQKTVTTTAANTNTKGTQTNNYLGEKLDDLALKLANIEQQISSKNTVVNLDPIRQQLAQLASQSKALATESRNLISEQIKDSTSELNQQLKIIGLKLNRLQAAQSVVKYIKADQLPFKVISVDNIQSINVVTVNYNHTTFPLNSGDYLAGWKLISANFEEQRCEFINSKTQHVVVDLNRINGK